jgi:hypothetical protein
MSHKNFKKQEYFIWNIFSDIGKLNEAKELFERQKTSSYTFSSWDVGFYLDGKITKKNAFCNFLENYEGQWKIFQLKQVHWKEISNSAKFVAPSNVKKTLLVLLIFFCFRYKKSRPNEVYMDHKYRAFK